MIFLETFPPALQLNWIKMYWHVHCEHEFVCLEINIYYAKGITKHSNNNNKEHYVSPCDALDRSTELLALILCWYAFVCNIYVVYIFTTLFSPFAVKHIKKQKKRNITEIWYTNFNHKIQKQQQTWRKALKLFFIISSSYAKYPTRAQR